MRFKKKKNINKLWKNLRQFNKPLTGVSEGEVWGSGISFFFNFIHLFFCFYLFFPELFLLVGG